MSMADRKRFHALMEDGTLEPVWGYPVDFEGERFFIYKNDHGEWKYTHAGTGVGIQDGRTEDIPEVRFTAGTLKDLPPLKEIVEGVGREKFWNAIERVKQEVKGS